MRNGFVRSIQLPLVVYSATSIESFAACGDYIDQVCRVMDSSWWPIIMVETKVDLVHERRVPTAMGPKAARSRGCLFIRTSAKTGEGVEEAFSGCAHLFSAARTGALGPTVDSWVNSFVRLDVRRKKNANCLLA